MNKLLVVTLNDHPRGVNDHTSSTLVFRSAHFLFTIDSPVSEKTTQRAT